MHFYGYTSPIHGPIDVFFVGLALEIDKGADLDPIRGYLQVQSFSLRQLHSDISAGIGQIEIFTQVPEADIDIPSAGGSGQAAGKIHHPYVTAGSAGVQFSIDLLSFHITAGSAGPDGAF